MVQCCWLKTDCVELACWICKHLSCILVCLQLSWKAIPSWHIYMNKYHPGGYFYFRFCIVLFLKCQTIAFCLLKLLLQTIYVSVSSHKPTSVIVFILNFPFQPVVFQHLCNLAEGQYTETSLQSSYCSFIVGQGVPFPPEICSYGPGLPSCLLVPQITEAFRLPRYS